MPYSRCELAAFFAKALPKEAVVANEGVLEERYLRNVTALHREVPLVLRPGCEAEVTSILKVANRQGVPLYPISIGKNWGLGSKLPVRDGCVIVDLSRMNRVLEISEEFGYAIIEPGVTQLTLAEYLCEHHPSLTMNFTGSFAHTSIVGNVLERGDGGTARVDDLLGVAGVLGSGVRFRVGGFWEGAEAAIPTHCSRYIAGPDLCGLFCQSSFGIVTRMAFRLVHRPDVRCAFWGIAAADQLEQLVDAAAALAKQGIINRGSVNIGYANRFVQAVSSMGGQAAATSPAPDEWNYYVLFGGTRRVAAAIEDDLRESLGPLSQQSGVFRPDARAATPPPFLAPLVAPLAGLPDAESIKLIYRLTGTPLPEDEREIDADQTPLGMKCCIPVVPPCGREVRRAAELVAGIRGRFGLNVKASFFGDGRTLITTHFRRDDAEQVRAAEECEAALWDALVLAGYPPYRASIDQMGRVVDHRPEFFGLVAALKARLDPRGIIAPGRYAPLGGAGPG